MVASILKTFLFILSSLCASVIIHQVWKSFRLWRRWGLGLPGETHPLPFPLVAAQGQTSRHTPAWFIGAFKASSSAAHMIYTVLSWQLLTLGNTAAYCKLATKDNGFYHSLTYSLQSLKPYSHSEIHLGDLRNIYSTVRMCDRQTVLLNNAIFPHFILEFIIFQSGLLVTYKCFNKNWCWWCGSALFWANSSHAWTEHRLNPLWVTEQIQQNKMLQNNWFICIEYKCFK